MADLSTATPAMLIKDYIIAYAPAGTFTGWVFKLGQLPPTGDRCIALIDQGGPPSFPHLLVDYRGLQVLVRGAVGDYQNSYVMANKVRDCILGMPGHPPEFTELDGVTERSTIVPLGYDDSNRHVWSNNFQLLVEPASNSLTHRESL